MLFFILSLIQVSEAKPMHYSNYIHEKFWSNPPVIIVCRGKTSFTKEQVKEAVDLWKKPYSKIVEKDTISDNPSEDPMALGSFWFRKGSDFIFAAKHAISNDITVNGEHYIANSINILLEKGKKFVCFDVDAWISFGDPFELKIYEYWEEYFEITHKWN